MALGDQLDDLVKSGFLNDYLLDRRTGGASSSQPEGGEAQQHEMPTHGEIHTIAGGFSGGGCTASQRKKYARTVMTVEMFEDHSPDVDITFTKQDLRDVVPHDNDPIVISLITAGRKVHRVLVDQVFRPVDRDVFVHDLNRQLGSPSRWLPADSCKKEDKEAP